MTAGVLLLPNLVGRAVGDRRLPPAPRRLRLLQRSHLHRPGWTEYIKMKKRTNVPASQRLSKMKISWKQQDTPSLPLPFQTKCLLQTNYRLAPPPLQSKVSDTAPLSLLRAKSLKKYLIKDRISQIHKISFENPPAC